MPLWTPSMVAEHRRLRPRLSAAQTGAILGLSKSAVLGREHRDRNPIPPAPHRPRGPWLAENAILEMMSDERERTTIEISQALRGPHYSTVWKTLRKLEQEGFISSSRCHGAIGWCWKDAE